MPIKAIIVDLDRTLLHTDKSISPYTVQVLNACKQQGIRVMAATARPLRTTKEYRDLIDFDAMVVSNGSRIVTENQLFENGISDESAKQLLMSLGKYPAIRITLETGESAYSNHFIEDYYTNICQDLLSIANAEGLLKINVHIDEEEIRGIVEEALPEDLYYTIANGYLLQIMDKSATKWNGIKKMLESFNIAAEDAVYFGDDHDDILPIQNCGLGIAVANAIAEVKAAADEVTESNDEDGVANYIVKHIRKVNI